MLCFYTQIKCCPFLPTTQDYLAIIGAIIYHQTPQLRIGSVDFQLNLNLAFFIPCFHSSFLNHVQNDPLPLFTWFYTAISEMRLEQQEKQRKEEDGNEKWN